MTLSLLAQISLVLFPVLATVHNFWQGVSRPLRNVRDVVVTPTLEVFIVHVEVVLVCVTVPTAISIGELPCFV